MAAANAYLVQDVDTTSSESSTTIFVGPFDTEPAAQEHAAKHQAENPQHLISVQTLINPANC